jgi:hypothetical protein
VSVLGPGEIRALRRPFALIAMALTRCLFGFVLAFPLASLVSASSIGSRAQGDRLLFESGGYFLLEIVRVQGDALLAAARGAVPVLLLGLLVTAFANAALLVALNERERITPGAWLGRAATRLGTFTALGAATTFGQLLIGGAALLGAGGVPDLATAPRLTSLLELGVWLIAAIAAGALGGFSDLTRASLVRHETPLLAALQQAFLCLRRHPLRGAFGFVPFAGLLGLAIAAAAMLTGWCDVGQGGAWRVAGVIALHQLVVLTAVACRSGWYARALRLVAAT